MTDELRSYEPGRSGRTIAHRQALRNALRFDAALASPVAGAVTALPVVCVFVAGLLAGNKSGAIAMAVGANLIAIASLVGAPRLSLRIAIVDAMLLGASVFVGTITGSVTWLHLLLLVPWCFGAGMLEVFGQTSATVGSQAVIAYVVLGRFIGSLSFAFHFSLLVALGALIEILALVLLRLPSSLRYQRSRLASSIEAVARLVLLDPTSSATEALASLDETEKVLDDPALFGRSDVRELRAILDQVRRIRLEITTLAGLRVRLRRLNDTDDEVRVAASLEPLAAALIEMARSLRQRETSPWRSRLAEFDGTINELGPEFVSPTDATILGIQSAEHLRAIAGQLRAMGKLIDTSGKASGRTMWRPTLPERPRLDWRRLRSNTLMLKDNLNARSPAFRHALRLAVAVPLAAVLGSAFGLPRSFWLTFAVLVILRPDYSSLLDRGLGRMLGTVIGATFAALLVGGLHPDLAVTTILVGLSAWIAYSTWYASFAISFGFITALVLILMSVSATDTLSTALDRLLDFSLGSVIALIAYLVWPTSLRTSVNDALANLFHALERYLEAVLALATGTPIEPDKVIARSRAVRVSWIRAESAVGRAVAEPGFVRSGPSDGRGQLATTMRILRTLHAIRVEAERGATVDSSRELEALRDGCTDALRALYDTDAVKNTGTSTNLRSLYRTTVSSWPVTRATETLAIHLDELVNAIDTAAQLTHSQSS
ncbi:MAG: FUSC family protein [Acidimicrobiales bacterium]